MAEVPAAGVYVYGIVGPDHPCALDDARGVGAEPTVPRRVAAGQVAAVVGDAPNGLRAKRRDVTAHHQLLAELARQGTVLPMRFGVVAPDEAALRADLERDGGSYAAALRELTGMSEYNVKLVPDEDALVRLVAASDPQVRRLREAGEADHDGQLRLGQAVAAAVETVAEADARLALAALGPLAERTATGPAAAGTAFNTSFLVDDGRVDEFTRAVGSVRERLAERGELRCTGPLPAYSFVPEGAGG